MEDIIQIQSYSFPCGKLILGSYNEKLCVCDWQNEDRRKPVDQRIRKSLQACYEEGEYGIIIKAIRQLNEYFDRKLTVFDIPLLFARTDFQKEVWNELLAIPYSRPSRMPYFPNVCVIL